MSFSDDDLKRLKESLDTYEDDQSQCYRVIEFEALLARLEAAERCLVMADQEDTLYEDWKRAAGK